MLITGGSRGLGLALARRFARDGAHVSIGARDERELDQVASELARSGSRVLTRVCDVADLASVEAWFSDVIALWGRIDVLVNNAGIIQVGPMETMQREDYETALAINFWGMVETTRFALPSMLGNRSGRIINVTSIGGVFPAPHLLPYSCSKFAAVGFSTGASVELAGSGVLVTTVVPGLMRTGSFLHALFKGRRKDEVTWFSLSSSTPFLSISAEKAARRIVEACVGGERWVVLGAQARVARLLFALFPSWTMGVLGTVNRGLLPNAPLKGSLDDRLPAKPGLLYRSRFSSPPFTWLGDRAARKYGEASGL